MDDSTHCMNCGRSHVESEEIADAKDRAEGLEKSYKAARRRIQQLRDENVKLRETIDKLTSKPSDAEAVAAELSLDRKVNQLLNGENLLLKEAAVGLGLQWQDFLTHIEKRGDHDAADTLLKAAKKIAAKYERRLERKETSINKDMEGKMEAA